MLPEAFGDVIVNYVVLPLVFVFAATAIVTLIYALFDSKEP